jgi:hypothetical protein
MADQCPGNILVCHWSWDTKIWQLASAEWQVNAWSCPGLPNYCEQPWPPAVSEPLSKMFHQISRASPQWWWSLLFYNLSVSVGLLTAAVSLSSSWAVSSSRWVAFMPSFVISVSHCVTCRSLPNYLHRFWACCLTIDTVPFNCHVCCCFPRVTLGQPLCHFLCVLILSGRLPTWSWQYVLFELLLVSAYVIFNFVLPNCQLVLTSIYHIWLLENCLQCRISVEYD